MIKRFIPVLAVLTLSGCAVDAENEGDDTVSTNAGAITGGTGGTGTAVQASCSDTTATGITATVNAIRTKLGMPALTCNAALTKATAWHAYYHGNNPTEPAHTEISGHTGYTAVNFWERDTNAGFTGSAAGEAWSGAGTYSEAINHPRWGWINSLLHNAIFMTYNTSTFGFGSYKNASGAVSDGTMDFGSSSTQTPSSATATYVWPWNGQTGVNTKFYCTTEGVCPGKTYPDGVGTVISLTAGGTTIASITTHTLKVASSGALVTHTLYSKSLAGTNTTYGSGMPANHVSMVPAAKLAVSTQYTATITGTVTQGTTTSNFTRTWSFTTAATDN